MLCIHDMFQPNDVLPAGAFDEFLLVDDYIPQEEDRKQHLLAKAGEVVKVLQQKESGMLHYTLVDFFILCSLAYYLTHKGDTNSLCLMFPHCFL